MHFCSGKYVPVFLQKEPRRGRTGKAVLIVILLIVCAVLLYILLRPNGQAPGSVVPVLTPEPVETAPVVSLPDTTGELLTDLDTDSGLNPVAQILTGLQSQYAKSYAILQPYAAKHSLALLSAQTTLEMAYSSILEPLEYFADMEQGELPGEWSGQNGAAIAASGGNYEFSIQLENGGAMKGVVATAGNRFHFGKYAQDAELPYLYGEMLSTADGYYIQIYEAEGVKATMRVRIAPDGVCSAYAQERMPEIYDQAPTGWDSYSAGCLEAMKAAEGGVVLRVGETQNIYD